MAILRSVLLFSLFAAQAPGILAQTPPPVVIVLVPGLRADDLTAPAASGLAKLAREGAVGWMNCRTARVPGQRDEPQEAAYVTLGAGARATAGPYAREVTREALARLIGDNSRLDHPVRVGALGDIIHASGGLTRVDGNEDDAVRRSAGAWLVADGSGVVNLLHTTPKRFAQPDPTAPFGVQFSDFGIQSSNAIWPDFNPSPPSLTVLYFGDLARADRYERFCTPNVAVNHRNRALADLSNVLTSLSLGYTERHGWGRRQVDIIVLAASPADTADSRDRLAPILMWGPDVKPGLLTSGSTHTPGLVTNTDFLPTVAGLLGLKTPPGMVGRPMTVVSHRGKSTFLSRLLAWLKIRPASEEVEGDAAEGWARLHDDWYARSRQQAAFGGLPTVQALIVVLAVGMGTFGGRLVGHRDKLRRWSAALPLVPLWLPLALLVLPAVSPVSVLVSGIVLACTLMVPVGVVVLRPATLQTMSVIPLASLAIVLALDLLVGTPLLRGAWMSYSVMEGARYYGIGNEYCGALLAAALGAAALLRPLRTRIAVAGLAGLALLVGLPGCGANAGGFLGLALGFGAAALVWWRGRLRLCDVIALVGVIALGLLAVVAWDLARSTGDQTHIARAVGGGPVQIALRKAELNAWLLTHSPWSLALLAAGAGLIGMWRRPDSPLRQRIRDDRRLAGAMAGMLVGSLGLLLLNDSGVVAAAESLMITWASSSIFARSAGPSLSDVELTECPA